MRFRADGRGDLYRLFLHILESDILHPCIFLEFLNRTLDLSRPVELLHVDLGHSGKLK